MIHEFIAEQPHAVERCVAAARSFDLPWSPDDISSIALVGSGSSFNALTTARPAFVTARRGAVTVTQPEDLAHELQCDDAKGRLVIVLSQSGASASSLVAMEVAQHARCKTLALTSSRASPLGMNAAHVLEMPIGDEPVGPKTKGFLGSVATLQVLAERVGGPGAQSISGEDIARVIEPAREAAYALAAELSSVDVITIVGRGANFGVALEASLKIAEMAGVPCAAFPTEELLHGRLHGITAASLVMMICGGAREVEEARHVEEVMAQHGCRVVAVDSSGQSWPPHRAPLTSPWDVLGLTIPFQWLAVALAEARGLQPHAMRYGALSRDLGIKVSAP
jgi:glucosamine--fructose-6-phosphate aminotransferase (isomerizing)